MSLTLEQPGFSEQEWRKNIQSRSRRARWMLSGLALVNTDIVPLVEEQDEAWLEKETSWRERAGCRQVENPDIFFPEKDESIQDAVEATNAKNQAIKQAKEICDRCLVRSECLQEAFDNNEQFGIWGGLTKKGRTELKKRIMNPR